MKVIKQLSEDQFVVQMEECDLITEKRMVVAHDYVQFGANMGIMLDSKADWHPYGKFAGIASNWIKHYTDVQIGIRTFIKVVLPHLLNNKNCKESHLVNEEDGTLRYNWEASPIVYTDNSGKKVVAMKNEDGTYTILPLEIYNQIKNHFKKY